MDARNLRAIHANGIIAIVDLAADEPAVQPTRDLIYLRMPLVDGQGNSAAHLRLCVTIVSQLLNENIPTLVACSAGMSRSPATVAAALSVTEATPFEEALTRVTSGGPCDISPTLMLDLRAAIQGFGD